MHASMGALEPVSLPAPGYVESRHSTQRSGLAPHDGDAALALRLAAGDTTALDALYQRHYEAALSVALALLRNRGAAEDLVHEAFLRAWRRAGSFRSHRGTFRSWLLTIVRNAAIDQLRREAMQRNPKIAAAQVSLHSSTELDIPAQAILSLEVELLYQALNQLAPEQRMAIQHAFFAELTHREIAEREGLPLGTVKGRVRLGLARLRRFMDNPEQLGVPVIQTVR